MNSSGKTSIRLHHSEEIRMNRQRMNAERGSESRPRYSIGVPAGAFLSLMITVFHSLPEKARRRRPRPNPIQIGR